MSYNQQGICWRCGHPLLQTGYMYDSICPGCRTSTHVCRNCRFFSNSLANMCSEPSADLVVDKQRANLCTYFAAS